MTEQWFDVGVVKKIDQVIEKFWVSGIGKDAVYNEKHVGVKVILENGGAFVFPLQTTPDCRPGDKLLIQFERRVK